MKFKKQEIISLSAFITQIILTYYFSCPYGKKRLFREGLQPMGVILKMNKTRLTLLYTVPIILFIHISIAFAEPNGTFPKNDKYVLEQMDVITTDYGFPRFKGYIHNISNETIYLTGMQVHLYDNDSKLTNYYSTNNFTDDQEGTESISVSVDKYRPYRWELPPSNFDHYEIIMVLENKSKSNN